ncbi:hypothetical protein FORC087_278 (plasmid) [Bacillus cereus]|nr:hypothetical protein FORC087_278 [Bacillus cereus]
MHNNVFVKKVVALAATFLYRVHCNRYLRQLELPSLSLRLEVRDS